MAFIVDTKPNSSDRTVEVKPDGRVIHHNVRFRDARALPDGSAYVDTSDRADWLDQAIDELMNAGYVDIFHWERGGGRWTRVSYPRDFRSDREPVARVIRRVMRERGIVARARAR